MKSEGTSHIGAPHHRVRPHYMCAPYLVGVRFARHRLLCSKHDGLTMVPPPWHLVSPSGVLHHVPGADELLWLARQEGLITLKKNLLRELVDPSCKTALNKLPQHRQQWQLLERVRWLQRVDGGAIVLIVGDAYHFMKTRRLEANVLTWNGTVRSSIQSASPPF